MARFGRSRRQSAAIEKVPHMVEHHNEDHKTTPSIQRIQSHPARFHQHTCKHVSSSQHFLICSDVWASYPSAARRNESATRAGPANSIRLMVRRTARAPLIQHGSERLLRL